MNRYLGRAAYLIAFALIVIPLFDSSMSVMPLRFGDSRWRYGSIGLLSNALMIPMSGILIAFVTATVLEHRRALRVGGVLAWISVVICLLALVAFALDALQSQGQIRPEMRTSFAIASSIAAAKILLGALSFSLFGIAGLKSSPATTAKPAKRTSMLIPESPVPKPSVPRV